MSQQSPASSLPLFVPANRPERFTRALQSGADAIIIDLEDAVTATDKIVARDGLRSALAAWGKPNVPIWLRINSEQSLWFENDLKTVNDLPLTAIMLPKTENTATLAHIRKVIPQHLAIIALIETASGLANTRNIAKAADRLAFGSIDFSVDLGCAHSRDALLCARHELVLASRLTGLAAPLDGITTAIHDETLIEDDACYASSLGFGGKMLIHPAQIIPARRGFLPSDTELQWARNILMTTENASASAVNGEMVDAPVLARARALLARSAQGDINAK